MSKPLFSNFPFSGNLFSGGRAENPMYSRPLDRGDDPLLSNLLFGDDVFSGGGSTLSPPVYSPVSGGGELIFLHARTGKVMLVASSFNCMLFDFNCKTTPRGGVEQLSFSFTYTGSYPDLGGAKIRIRVQNQEIGYAAISSFSFKRGILQGEATSIWVDVAGLRAARTFYRTNSTLFKVIEDYAEWLGEEADTESFWWPARRADFKNADKSADMPITSIDTRGRTIKEALDIMATMGGLNYEMRNDMIVFYSPKRRVMTNVFGIELAPDMDKVVNTLEIFGLDRASMTITKQQTIVDEESIRMFGVKLGQLEVPYHVEADYNLYKDKMLTPMPLTKGSFKIIAKDKVLFDDFFVPQYQRNVYLSLCNSLKGWEGALLVPHPINNQAIEIDGEATLTYKGALDSVRIVGRGAFTVSFVGYGETSEYSFDSSGDAFKDMCVGYQVLSVVFRGQATLTAVSGITSQVAFVKARPTAIKYEVAGRSIIASCDVSNGQTVVDFLAKLKNNAKQQLDVISKEEENE